LLIKNYDLESAVQDGTLGGLSTEVAHALELCNELIAASQQPSQLIRQTESLGAEYSNAVEELSLHYLDLGTEPLGEKIQRHGRVIAGLRASLAGVAAERFRVANGDFPEQLDALVPMYLDSVPTDPYADKPLLYKQEDDRVMIYSVGENGQDDGGQTKFAQDVEEALDVGFVLLGADQRNRPAP
jgi:hypothetical protein